MAPTARSRTTGAKAAAAVQLKTAPAADDEVQGWDEYIAEAAPDIEPFRKRLPDGTLLEATWPDSDQMDALAAAQMRGDSKRMIEAAFGDNAPMLLELTAKLPFTVRIKLCNDLMNHYGMSLAQLPESDASSR